MYYKLINRVLLGLLMLVPGLFKLFAFKPSGVSAMLEGFGFPAAMFFAWVLIILEIASGLMILANYKMNYAVWPPVVILIVAAVVTLMNAAQPDIVGLLLHLTAASNYLLLWRWSMHPNGNKK